MECKLICIPTAELALHWPIVSSLIRAAVDRVDLATFDDIERNVFAGSALLWIATDRETRLAAAVTEIRDTGKRKICFVVACGAVKGAKKLHWPSLLEGIEQSARSAGCQAMCISGRHGWKRALNGYRATQIVLQKDLK